MDAGTENPGKTDITQATQELSAALKDGLRIVTVTLGDINGLRLFASFAGLDLQTDPQTPSSPNWKAEINQRLKGLNWEEEDEQAFNDTLRDLEIVTRKTSEALKAKYGEQEGLQKMADIANPYMPKDPNMRPKFQLTVPKAQN